MVLGDRQTELPIISVCQPLFCALIKGAACSLCVIGLHRHRCWVIANIMSLIIYVWDIGSKGCGGVEVAEVLGCLSVTEMH